MKLKIKHHFGLNVDLNIIDKYGRRRNARKNIPNLILDTGMVAIGNASLSSFQDYCHRGDDGTANNLDSGSTTASRSGTTVTASSGIFDAGMVGNLIHWDTGEEAYITSFTSSTEVETTDSGAIASGEFTIFFVDQTTLVSEVARTNTTQGTNNFAEASGVITRTRTHIFPAASGAQTVRELGWGSANSTTVFSRVVVSPAVPLADGDQLEVVSRFEIRCSPQTSSAVDPTTGEGNWAGNQQIEGYGIGNMDNSGNALEPAGTVRFLISTRTDALNTYGTNPSSFSGISNGYFTPTKSAAPTAPPWQRTLSGTIPTTGGNSGSIRSVIWGDPNASNAIYPALRLLLTSNQSKSSLQTLYIDGTVSWDRNLTN